ncbi:aldo/keto reductase [Novosphingobium album (ex Liu et al. 2023)]|uniref:Aldo/keto reductase n=1 Tax=Novosphingobium album (ex Liu et al. 2023) TaxID=3031130 RepID=A0ABT5WUP7_9SPHN|nr:aldo/keto reductase [Novosphingobium album (ex Liu et al. 2023)]MDE8653622.1 aldo/keto reductase [Novosphingobium album (ex Liu et al. 2023)]
MAETIAVDHPALGGIRLVFGGNVFGWTIDRDRSFAVLDAFYEAGGRMIDTADGYSSWVPGNKGGESETIIGQWLESRGVRAQMRIATKTGQGGPPGALQPEKVAAALEASLERLRTDYVDLYYAHRDDLTTPLDEVVSAYDAAFRSGKARELGASNYTAARLAEILDVADRQGARGYSVVEPLYNLVARDEYEGPLQALCLARNIAVLPYYGLASGFLTGKYRAASDWAGSTRAHALNEAAANGGWAVLAVLDAIAAETGATPAQIALAWINAKPGIAAPLASATTPAQLADLVGAVSLVLSADQIERLDRAAG